MVTDNKVAPYAGIGKKNLSSQIITAIDQTLTYLDVIQLAFGFTVERLTLWCSAVVSTVDVYVKILAPGKLFEAVTLTIGTTKSKFKLNNALLGVAPLRVGDALQVVLNKAIEDDIEFSDAFTINVAGDDGLFWGAVRIQIDATTGAVSTKVASDDQVWDTEAQALVACPDADVDQIDMGTITIQTKDGETFTAQTTELDDAVAVNDANYNGLAAGAVNVLDTDTSDHARFVAANFVEAVMKSRIYQRAIAQPGGLLVVQYTTSHTGVGTNARYNVQYRPFPMSGEVA